MKTKIFVGRDLIGRFTCDGKRYTKWQYIKFMVVRTTKRTLLAVAGVQLIIWGLVGAYAYGKLNAPIITHAEIKTVEVPVYPEFPILARIAKCESGGSQYDKTGQVQIHVNSNGTVDVGKFMLNSVWKAQATKLGLDITKEADNEKMATWIFLNRGTSDWSASAKCWSKM